MTWSISEVDSWHFLVISISMYIQSNSCIGLHHLDHCSFGGWLRQDYQMVMYSFHQMQPFQAQIFWCDGHALYHRLHRGGHQLIQFMQLDHWYQYHRANSHIRFRPCCSIALDNVPLQSHRGIHFGKCLSSRTKQSSNYCSACGEPQAYCWLCSSLLNLNYLKFNILHSNRRVFEPPAFVPALPSWANYSHSGFGFQLKISYCFSKDFKPNIFLVFAWDSFHVHGAFIPFLWLLLSKTKWALNEVQNHMSCFINGKHHQLVYYLTKEERIQCPQQFSTAYSG